LSALIIFIAPVNSSVLLLGAVTFTVIVTHSPSCKSLPLSGSISNIAPGQLGADSNCQFKSVPLSPQLHTLNVPETVLPGVTSCQMRLPSQQISGFPSVTIKSSNIKNHESYDIQ